MNPILSIGTMLILIFSCNKTSPPGPSQVAVAPGMSCQQTAGSARPFLAHRREQRRQRPVQVKFSPSTVLFGTEFELPLTELPPTDAERDFALFALGEVNKILAQKCQKCPSRCEIDAKDAGRVTVYQQDKTPDSVDLYYRIDTGVIEITSTPLTYKQWESWAPIIKEFVFDFAKTLQESGLVTSPELDRNRWSGHINVSWEGIDTHSKLIMNLFTDWQNFPELGMGVLGGDIRNATPLVYGSASEQNKLKKLINLYKAQKPLNDPDSSRYLDPLNASDLALFIRNNIVPVSYQGRYNMERFSLVNLAHLAQTPQFCLWDGEKARRIELRGFFSPMSTEEMLFYYRTVMGRLKYLVGQDVIDFNPRIQIADSYRRKKLSEHINDGLQGGLTPEQAASAFIRYLKDSGLDPFKEAVYLRDPAVKKAVLEQAKLLNNKKAS